MYKRVIIKGILLFTILLLSIGSANSFKGNLINVGTKTNVDVTNSYIGSHNSFPNYIQEGYKSVLEDRISPNPIIDSITGVAGEDLEKHQFLGEKDVFGGDMSKALEPLAISEVVVRGYKNFSIGISNYGELCTSSVGIEYPVGYEHIAIGTYLEGYTIGYYVNGTLKLAYSNYDHRSNIVPLSVYILANTTDLFRIKVETVTSDNLIKITNEFIFFKNTKHVIIFMYVENIGNTTLENVVVKRNVDIDVDTGGAYGWAGFDNYFDWEPTLNLGYAWTNSTLGGGAGPDPYHYVGVAVKPNPSKHDLNGWDDYSSYDTDEDIVDGVVYGDYLVTNHWDFPLLRPGEILSFRIVYAAANSYNELVNEIIEGLNFGGKVAIFYDNLPWGDYNVTQEILAMYNITYDEFNSSDFLKVNLSDYSKVIILSDQSNTFYSKMNESVIRWFEEYVRMGGVLEFHACDNGWHSGQWIIGPGNITHVTYYTENVSIVLGDHPILFYPYTISDSELDNWFWSAHGYFTNLPANATVILVAENNLSMPVLVEFPLGAGWVIASMQTLEWGYYKNYSKFLENVILYRLYVNRTYAYTKNIMIIKGDWVVSDNVTYKDYVIILNGNLIIEPNATLYLENVKLYINSSYDGEFYILVKGFGNLTLVNSEVKAYYTYYGYLFYTEYNGILNVFDSVISYCGANFTHPGLVIESQNVTIFNSIISNCYTGIYVNRTTIVLNNTKIVNNVYGIYVKHGELIANGIYVAKNIHGVTSYYSNVSIYSSTITQNSYEGVYAYETKLVLMGNVISNNRYGVILQYSPRSVLKNNNFINDSLEIFGSELEDFIHEISNNYVNGYSLYYILNATDYSLSGGAGEIIIVNSYRVSVSGINIRDAEIGVLVAYSEDVSITYSTLENLTDFGVYAIESSISILYSTLNMDHVGLYGFLSDIYVGNSIVMNTYDHGISLYYSNITLENVEIHYSGWDGINLFRSSMEAMYLFINGSTFDGIDADHYSNVTVYYSTIAYSGDNGIELDSSYLFASHITVENNEYSGIFVAYSTMFVTHSSIINNYGNGIYCYGYTSIVEIHWSYIFGNYRFGILNNADEIYVNATYNWWNSLDGPDYNSSSDQIDPEEVFGNVLYEPHLPYVGVVVGKYVSGTAEIKVFGGSENLYRLAIFIDNRLVAYWMENGEYTYYWDTSGYSDGEHTIIVAAIDNDGYRVEKTVKVIVDNTEPEAEIISPTGGTYLRGSVAIKVYFNDKNIEVAKLKIDNYIVATWSNNGYFSYTWDTTAYENGKHEIALEVYDKANNVKLVNIFVYVDNSPPKITVLTTNLEEVYDNSSVKVYAEVKDDLSGVEIVILSYSINGSDFTNITMAYRDGRWFAEIPKTGSYSIVKFYIIAIDKVGNVAKSDTYAYFVKPASGESTNVGVGETNQGNILSKPLNIGNPIIVGGVVAAVLTVVLGIVYFRKRKTEGQTIKVLE